MNTKLITRFIGIAAVGLLSGCASSGGSHSLLTAPLNKSDAAHYSELAITVKPSHEVKITSADSERLKQKIAEEVKADADNRFTSINEENPGTNTLEAEVEIKRYDEGNAFARAMLAGLGQIHVDADVTLSDFNSKQVLAKYEVTKTFAWGGLVGASTNIQDVEEGFCKAVSESILGKD
jgi:hypothetical protein